MLRTSNGWSEQARLERTDQAGNIRYPVLPGLINRFISRGVHDRDPRELQKVYPPQPA